MSTLLFLVFFVVMTIMAAYIINVFYGGALYYKASIKKGYYRPLKIVPFKRTGVKGWVMSALYAVIVTVCHILLQNVEKFLWAAPIIFIVMIGAMLAPFLVFDDKVRHETKFKKRGQAILPIVVLEVPVFLATLSAAAATTALWEDTNIFAVFMTKMFGILPILAAIFVIFGMLISILKFNKRRDEAAASAELRDNAKFCGTVATALRVVAGIAMAAILIFCTVAPTVHAAIAASQQSSNTGRSGSNGGSTGNGNAGSTEEAWATWYCLDSKTKVDEFGPNPFKKEWVDHPEKAWETFKADCLADPLIGVSAVYYNDSVTGNRYLLKYYKEFDNDTDAINAAILDYVTGTNRVDGTAWRSLCQEDFEWIEEHNPKIKVLTGRQLLDLGIKVEDQIYANPKSHQFDETGFEVPNAIVYNCGQGSEKDYYLVVTFKIKNRKVTEIWHINCRWQACNTEKVMRVKPKKRPEPEPESPTKPEEPTTKPEEPTTKPEEPTTKPEEPTTKPEEPTTKPEEPTVKPKDKTKGVPDPGNKTKDAGPNTNNGKGATHSKAEKPNNSQELENSKDFNKKSGENSNTGTQKPDNSRDNTPSVKPNPGTKVDNNGYNNNQVDTNQGRADDSMSDADKGEWY